MVKDKKVKSSSDVRDHRVIWHPCIKCGRDWPFPFPDGALDREWICSICVNVEWARLQRILNENNNSNQG